MTSDDRTQGRAPIDLIVAGGVMFLTGLSIAGVALMTTEGAGFSFTSSSIGLLAVALVFAAVGIEIIRRRHFLFVFLVPVVLALVNLGYAIGTGQAAMLWPSVAIWVVVAILVQSRRSDFRD
jgi:hypothetical protein